jgi:hypothetical protein
MRPGKGLGTVERLRGGVTGVGGIGRAAAGSEGHPQARMRTNHSRAIRTSWSITGLDTMAQSPHTGGERGMVPDWRAIGITRRLEVHDPAALERAIVHLRDRLSLGESRGVSAQVIREHLRRHHGEPLPSRRTIYRILKRYPRR